MITNLRAIYIFVKAVELGSFRATANALDLSASVVSYQVSRLEAELKVALLYRSTRKLTLTDAGKTLFEKVAPLVRGAEQAVDLLTSKTADPVGSLNLTMASSFSREDITRLVARFAVLHPGVELAVEYSDEQKDLIADNIDLAIRSGPIEDSSLKAVKLFTIERKLVASPGFLAGMPGPATPADLADRNWIWLSVTPRHRIFVNRHNGKRHRLKLKRRVTVNDGYAMAEFAVEGLGLLTSPLYLVDAYLQEGRLVELLPGWRVEPIDVYAIWPPNAPRSGLTGRFVEYLRQNLG